jgi:hypothetical protein
MPNVTFARYKQAADTLAEQKGYVIAVFTSDRNPTAFVFKVYKQGKSEEVPVAAWPITIKRDASGIAVIESIEYLLKPGTNIPGSKTYEFHAVLEMLEEREPEEDEKV